MYNNRIFRLKIISFSTVNKTSIRAYKIERKKKYQRTITQVYTIKIKKLEFRILKIIESIQWK